jgi:hypothetical protein
MMLTAVSKQGQGGLALTRTLLENLEALERSARAAVRIAHDFVAPALTDALASGWEARVRVRVPPNGGAPHLAVELRPIEGEVPDPPTEDSYRQAKMHLEFPGRWLPDALALATLIDFASLVFPSIKLDPTYQEEIDLASVAVRVGEHGEITVGVQVYGPRAPIIQWSA